MNPETKTSGPHARTGFELVSPKGLLGRDDLTRDEKVEMLRQWELDLREEMVAEEENMRASVPSAVALDEVLTNIAQYAYPDPGDHAIHVVFGVYHDRVEVVIEDGGRPFDPLGAPPPDRAAPLSDRRVGGLGIHFVRNLMSEVQYARVGETNRLTLKRFLSDRKG